MVSAISNQGGFVFVFGQCMMFKWVLKFKPLKNETPQGLCRLFRRCCLVFYDRYFHSPIDYIYNLDYNGINQINKLLDVSEFIKVNSMEIRLFKQEDATETAQVIAETLKISNSKDYSAKYIDDNISQQMY